MVHIVVRKACLLNLIWIFPTLVNIVHIKSPGSTGDMGQLRSFLIIYTHLLFYISLRCYKQQLGEQNCYVPCEVLREYKETWQIISNVQITERNKKQSTEFT